MCVTDKYMDCLPRISFNRLRSLVSATGGIVEQVAFVESHRYLVEELEIFNYCINSWIREDIA